MVNRLHKTVDGIRNSEHVSTAIIYYIFKNKSSRLCNMWEIPVKKFTELLLQESRNTSLLVKKNSCWSIFLKFSQKFKDAIPKEEKNKEKISKKKIVVNIPFNETFSVATISICEMNLNHRKNLPYISEEFRLPCRHVVRNFWGQESFLKISAKIPIFPGDKTTCWHYSGFLSRACSLIVMLFEIKCKRNWMLRHEREDWERRIPPICCQLLNGGLFFQKQTSHSKKYSVTSIHPAWA